LTVRERNESVVAQYLDPPEFKARQLGSFDPGDIELATLPDFQIYVPKFDPLVAVASMPLRHTNRQ